MKKWRKIISLSLATLMFVGSLAGCASTGGGTSTSEEKVKKLNYVLYDKKGSLYYSALDGSDDILVAKSDEENEYGRPYEYGAMTTLTENQNRLFYIKPINGDMYNGTLCYRDVLEDKSLSDEVVIAKKAGYYKVSAGGETVIFCDYEGDVTMAYDVENEEEFKLGTSSHLMEISSDGKRAIYACYDSEKDKNYGYEVEFGNDPQQLKQSFWSISHFEKDLSSYYFTYNEALYKKEFGGDAEKIVKNISSVEKMYDDGRFYYVLYDPESTDFDISDFLIDDMKESDANIEVVEYPAFLDREKFDSDAAWEAAYAEYMLQMEQAAATYDKTYRDEVREAYEGAAITTSNMALYFYDGKESHLVADFLTQDTSSNYLLPKFVFFESEPGVVFQSAFEFDGKVKMSEIEDYYSPESIVQTAMAKISKLYIARGGKIQDIDLPSKVGAMDKDQLKLAKDEKSFYLLHNAYDEELYYDLYQFHIDDFSVTDSERVAKQVGSSPWMTFDDGRVLYSTIDFHDGYYIGDIYLGEEKIAKFAYLVFSNDETQEFALLENFDLDAGTGTLVYYKNFEPQEIDKKVQYAYLTPAGETMYRKNVDRETWVGDLYHYNNGEGELVSKKASYVDTTMRYEDLVG